MSTLPMFLYQFLEGELKVDYAYTGGRQNEPIQGCVTCCFRGIELGTMGFCCVPEGGIQGVKHSAVKPTLINESRFYAMLPL